MKAQPKPQKVEQKVEQKEVKPNVPEVKKDPKEIQKPKNPFELAKDLKKEEPKKEKKEELVQRTFKGMQILDKKLGNGPVAKVGNKVAVKYILRLNNETGKIIEQSQKNFNFTLGAGQVISGWDLGVPGMKVGGKRVLTVPPSLGYGGQKSGPIPANSVLCFEIELFEVK